MCVGLSVAMDMYMQVPEEAREGVRSSGVEVTGDHETPDVDDGQKLKISKRTLFQSQDKMQSLMTQTLRLCVCV